MKGKQAICIHVIVSDRRKEAMNLFRTTRDYWKSLQSLVRRKLAPDPSVSDIVLSIWSINPSA